MKNLFIKFLKIFLIVSAILLIALIVFGFVLSMDWPWWIGIFLLMGIVGIYVGFLFIRKILQRNKEKNFIQQIVADDERHLENLKGKERDEYKDLQGKWREGVEALKRSHLRKYGNPLYVLPWYLILGESGAGKTTAISSANLSSTFAEVGKTAGISGTRSCDWWFFEQAIILDTAGRWSIPVDEGRDKDEWQKFLSLLVKYRKREPINGIIVAVAADKLLEASPEVLKEDGRNIRRRVAELVRVLGFKMPIYVLITKCDLIQGMAKFCDELPEKSLDQPMGVINQNLSPDVAGFLEQAIGTIGERLRNLRLLLLHKPETKEGDTGILLFAEEFKNLKRGIESFIKEAFLENPYQEAPVLRGIFFSSGRQVGSPFSHFLNELGLIGEREILPGTNKGLFLHDFFLKILPIDRKLFSPTSQTLEWSKLTKNLGLTLWFILCIAISGILSLSFVKNLKIIRGVPNVFLNSTVLKGETLDDIIIMDNFKETILKVEDQNRNWWIPRFGLHESKNVETQLKNKYCKRFADRFSSLSDKRLETRLANLSHKTSYEVLGQYVSHLVKCINLLNARMKGDSFEKIRSIPLPFRDSYIPIDDQELSADMRERFAELYLYNVFWAHDANSLNKEMNNLQKWLKHILSAKGATLGWLVSWANSHPSLSSSKISLVDFWGDTQSDFPEAVIPPAYTIEGKKMIDSFLSEIESALTDPLVIANQKIAFHEMYREDYIKTWHGFGTVFPKGIEGLNGKVEYQKIAARIAMSKGPYFSLLDRMKKELQPIIKGEDSPEWIKNVYSLNSARLKLTPVESDGEKSIYATAAETGKKLLGKLEKTGKDIENFYGRKNPEYQTQIENAFRDYQSALTAIKPLSSSRDVAFQMATQIFSEDPVTSTSHFFMADNAVNRLRATMEVGGADSEMFWELVAGPLEFLKKYTIWEAACYLQKLWESEVLVEIEGISHQKNLNLLLLGPEGYAMKFLRGPAAPFLDKDPEWGYYAKKEFGIMMPFEESFLTFVTGGYKTARSIQKEYSITIKTIPTDVNQGGMKPHRTSLELKCGGNTQSLVNFNYDATAEFIWTPEICSDVILQIDVGEGVGKINLIKRYEGAQAFPDFLREFSGGQRIFQSNEFGKERQVSLERLGIKNIKVQYEFSGHLEILKHFQSLMESVPRSIVSCWEY